MSCKHEWSQWKRVHFTDIDGVITIYYIRRCHKCNKMEKTYNDPR